MKIIPKGSSFCGEGGIVLIRKEFEAIVHALTEEYNRVVSGGGERYGLMTVPELWEFIRKLRTSVLYLDLREKEERGV